MARAITKFESEPRLDAISHSGCYLCVTFGMESGWTSESESRQPFGLTASLWLRGHALAETDIR